MEVTMPLDPTSWSNFRAEDLQGVELMLEAFILEGSSRDRELRFGEGLRFEEDELEGEGEVTATRSGSYGYRYTSRTTGELELEFDDGEACQVRLTFSGEGTGSYSYRCQGTSRGQGSFELSELVNRVPEITSTGSLFIPVILSSAGRNRSFFTSELTLTNRGEQEVRLDYTYTARDEPERRSGTASDVLPAGSQKIEIDALDYLRNLGATDSRDGEPVGDAEGGGAVGLGGGGGGADHHAGARGEGGTGLPGGGP